MLGPHQAPVEVVDPGVVGALEADRLAALALLDRGPPVAAHVVERADDRVPAADEQHLLAEHLEQPEAAGLGDLLGAGHRDPVAQEDLLGLPGEDRLVVIGAGGQERGAWRNGAPDPRQLLRCERRGRAGRGRARVIDKGGPSSKPQDRSR